LSTLSHHPHLEGVLSMIKLLESAATALVVTRITALTATLELKLTASVGITWQLSPLAAAG
jgi:hypothetical protein